MFCNNCGKKLPEGSFFCDNCGTRQVSDQMVFDNSKLKNNIIPPTVKTRDEFATIFLWVILYIFGIAGVILLILPNPFESMYFKLYGLLLFAGAVCIFFILKWHKWAFYCLGICGITGGILTGALYNDISLDFEKGFITGIIVVFIFIAIVFGILQIKNRHEVSTWMQMK